MAQTPLTDDLNVIGNSDLEITLLNGNLNIIQQLDDEPNDVGGFTAAELKAKFDESGLTIQKYINETLIPEVLAEQAVENARISAENQRIANENARIAAENNRVNTNTGIVAQATAQAKEAKKQADRAEAAASGGNHASRHAANGPDPITPAAIGAAPSGFGLGTYATALSSADDLNIIWRNGVYYWYTDAPANAPDVACILWVSTLCANKNNHYSVYQKVRCKKTGDADKHYTISRHLVFNPSTGACEVSTPWEYENPTLSLGVVYRTTERYQDKPVYCILFDFGTLPNTGTRDEYLNEKYPDIKDVQNIFIDLAKSQIFPNNAPTSRNNLLPVHPNITQLHALWGDGIGKISATTTSDLSGYSAYLCLKFTKIHD